jgi:hypothetical protein
MQTDQQFCKIALDIQAIAASSRAKAYLIDHGLCICPMTVTDQWSQAEATARAHALAGSQLKLSAAAYFYHSLTLTSTIDVCYELLCNTLH